MVSPTNAVRYRPFRFFAQNFGQVFKSPVFIAAEVQQGIAVAHNALPIVLEQTFQLRDALQDDVAADIAAAAHRKDFFEIFGERHIGELVHHQTHMNRQGSFVGRIGIRQPEQLVKNLGVEHGNEEVVGFVIIRDDTEDHPLLQAQLRQEGLVSSGHIRKPLRVEHIQVRSSRDQHRLQRLCTAKLKALILQYCRMFRVLILQFIEKHGQRSGITLIL